FNDAATTEIYTLSLHDALPISSIPAEAAGGSGAARQAARGSRHRGDRFGLEEDRRIVAEGRGRNGQRRETACEGHAARRAPGGTARARAAAASRGGVPRHSGFDGRRGR